MKRREQPGKPASPAGGLAPPKDGKSGRGKPPPDKGATRKGKDAKGKKTGAIDPKETEAHAQEVREVIRGRDIVEPARAKSRAANAAAPVVPAPFEQRDLMAVRQWLGSRPLEPAPNATVLVHFPRLWATNRGRYAKFRAQGIGEYGLVRARPSF